MLDREVPGLAEAIRAAGVAAGVPTAMLSRGLAGVAGGPSSSTCPAPPAASVTGWRCSSRVLPHALSQIRGGDHVRPP